MKWILNYKAKEPFEVTRDKIQNHREEYLRDKAYSNIINALFFINGQNAYINDTNSVTNLGIKSNVDLNYKDVSISIRSTYAGEGEIDRWSDRKSPVYDKEVVIESNSHSTLKDLFLDPDFIKGIFTIRPTQKAASDLKYALRMWYIDDTDLEVIRAQDKYKKGVKNLEDGVRDGLYTEKYFKIKKEELENNLNRTMSFVKKNDEYLSRKREIIEFLEEMSN